MQALVAPRFDEARRAAHASAVPLSTEAVAVGLADRRTLRVDVRSLTPLPPRDASAMDGWAVCGAGPWRVVGDLRAGHHAHPPLEPGSAVTIATGAALPEGTTGVLRTEHGALEADALLHGAVGVRQDVRPAGEEATTGEVLIAAGTVLGPAQLGLASAAGHDELVVTVRPRAHVLVLGDELLRTGVARDGKVRDSLGVQVPSWLVRLGLDVVGADWVPDAHDAHVRAVEAAGDVDLVITTGGTAAGPVDLVRATLAGTGGVLLVDTVAVRPGSPMLLGSWPGGRWLVGLPGNPQAAIAALLTLGGPLLDGLNGRPVQELDSRRLVGRIASRGDRDRLVACRETNGHVTPAEFIGSGMLRGLGASDGFAFAPGGQAVEGDDLLWLPLP